MTEPLRIGFVAGTLGVGGAERQLAAMVKALKGSGAEVQICSLTRGERYESVLRELAEVHWVGDSQSPMPRALKIVRRMSDFRPHVMQAAHSFVNLYVAIAAALGSSIAIGAMRGSLRGCREANGQWMTPQLRLPDAIITNSERCRNEVLADGILPPCRIRVVPNVIELPAPARAFCRTVDHDGPIRAAFVGRLIPSKRLDLFLRALAIARKQVRISGLVIGTGSALEAMKQLALELGLTGDSVEFLGVRNDVHAELARADFLVSCSDDEGMSNVVLEAMAAGLPVISTPAGDAETVLGSDAGLLVPFDDAEAIASRMIQLATSTELRMRLGAAGRARIQDEHSPDLLPGRLLSVYRDVANRRGASHVLGALHAATGAL